MNAETEVSEMHGARDKTRSHMENSSATAASTGGDQTRYKTIKLQKNTTHDSI